MNSVMPSPPISLVSGVPVVSSLHVAEHFEKSHKNVLQAISSRLSGLDPGFSQLNFQPAEYLDEQKKPRPSYNLTRDGFTLVAMGFTGAKALAWQVRYIQAFNAMEAELRKRPSPEPEPYDLPDQAFFTLKEVAAILGLTSKHLGQNILRKELPVHQLQKKGKVLIARADLLEWIKRARSGQPAPLPSPPHPAPALALPDPELDPCTQHFAAIIWNLTDVERASQRLHEAVSAKLKACGPGRSRTVHNLGLLKSDLFAALNGNIKAIDALAKAAFALPREFVPRT